MPEEIQSADMTADWEAKLLQIERGEMEPEEFMTEINTMIYRTGQDHREMKKGANALMKNKIVGVCPNCGKAVQMLWSAKRAGSVRTGSAVSCCGRIMRSSETARQTHGRSCGGQAAAGWSGPPEGLQERQGQDLQRHRAAGSCEADGRSKFSLEFEGGC